MTHCSKRPIEIRDTSTRWKSRLQSSPFFLSQPANDAGEATGVRCATARDWRKGREESFLFPPCSPAHLTPVASRAPASFAGWERKKGLLCSLLKEQQDTVMSRNIIFRAEFAKRAAYRPVYTGDFCCDFVAISRRLQIARVNYWRFRGDLNRQ